jgi:hypothetical protein
MIPFPRDVAHLRNAYQSHPGLSGLGAGNPDPQQPKNLPLPLDDRLNTTDSIPDFAAQTVVSQETTALQIGNRIRHEDIHFAGIVGSGTLDVLFVSRFLRDATPNVRLFVLNPDILFVHAADALPFEGILAVTTYPLLDGNPPFAHERHGEKHWIFSAPFQQGIHNAMRVLLSHIRLPPPGKHLDLFLPGYESLNPGEGPALWITSVGRESFVPIAALAVEPNVNKAQKSHLFPVLGSAELLSDQAVHHPTRLWWILLVASTAAMVGMFRLIREAQGTSKDCLVDYSFRNVSSGQALYLSMLMIFAVGAYLVMASTGVALFKSAPTRLRPELGNPLFFTLLSLIGLGVITCLIRLWLRENSVTPINMLMAILAAAIVLLTFFLFLRLNSDTASLSGIFFAFRSYELSAGASPTVPFFFLLAGFMVWSFVNLHREIFHRERRRNLPRPACDAILTEGIGPAADRLVDHIRRPFRSSPGSSTALATVALIACCFWLRISLRSFEGVAYDWLFVVCASALSAALIVSAWHFLRWWFLLDHMLDQLETHPLRRGLEALPPDESWSPIWQSNPRKRNHLILTRSLEALAALPAADLSSLEAAQIFEVTQSAGKILSRVAKGERQTEKEHLRVQKALQVVAESMIVRLCAQWRTGNSEILESRAKDGKGGGEAPNRHADEAPPLVYALEFVAMRYLAFIRYAMLQLRNMLTFITLGFLAFSFALMSYPFQGERSIAWLVTALFIVLSAIMVFVFVEMESDPLLGRITSRDGAKSGLAIAHRLLVFGTLPLLTVLATNFNGVGRLLFSWIEPALKTLH